MCVCHAHCAEVERHGHLWCVVNSVKCCCEDAMYLFEEICKQAAEHLGQESNN